MSADEGDSNKRAQLTLTLTGVYAPLILYSNQWSLIKKNIN